MPETCIIPSRACNSEKLPIAALSGPQVHASQQVQPVTLIMPRTASNPCWLPPGRVMVGCVAWWSRCDWGKPHRVQRSTFNSLVCTSFDSYAEGNDEAPSHTCGHAYMGSSGGAERKLKLYECNAACYMIALLAKRTFGSDSGEVEQNVWRAVIFSPGELRL